MTKDEKIKLMRMIRKKRPSFLAKLIKRLNEEQLKIQRNVSNLN
jgi:hypothetical protein